MKSECESTDSISYTAHVKDSVQFIHYLLLYIAAKASLIHTNVYKAVYTGRQNVTMT